MIDELLELVILLALFNLIPSRWWARIGVKSDRLPLRCFDAGLHIQIHRYSQVRLTIGWRTFYWEHFR